MFVNAEQFLVDKAKERVRNLEVIFCLEVLRVKGETLSKLRKILAHQIFVFLFLLKKEKNNNNVDSYKFSAVTYKCKPIGEARIHLKIQIH